MKYLELEEIWRKADTFREKLAQHDLDKLPIDIIYYVETVLKLDIIPVPDLFSDHGIDAALSPDLSGFYIDEKSYLSWESGQNWIEKRLRFSFAHELGHYILHKDHIQSNKFDSIFEFKRWAIGSASNQSPEFQADEFAGRLLVPKETLEKIYDEYTDKIKDADPEWRDISGLREHLAEKIAPRFGVNKQVIEVRLDRERIWPAG